MKVARLIDFFHFIQNQDPNDDNNKIITILFKLQIPSIPVIYNDLNVSNADVTMQPQMLILVAAETF